MVLFDIPREKNPSPLLLSFHMLLRDRANAGPESK